MKTNKLFLQSSMKRQMVIMYIYLLILDYTSFTQFESYIFTSRCEFFLILMCMNFFYLLVNAVLLMEQEFLQS